MDIISKFNTQLINFHIELEKLNIDKKLINNSKTKIFLLKKTNPKKIIEIFIENIYEYKNQIINKNEEFINNIKTENTNNGKIFESIKNNWKNYNDNIKENIWLYMYVFISLSDKYMENINNK